MQPFAFGFTFDSSGSADDILLPQNFTSGVCTIRLKPPAGHAWNFVGLDGTTFPLDMDEVLTLGPGYFAAGQKLGAASLDTGSGTGKGIAS